MGVEIEIPEGHKLVTRVGYRIPDYWHSIQDVLVTGRRWWEFWLPKSVNLYCVVVRKKTRLENSYSTS